MLIMLKFFHSLLGVPCVCFWPGIEQNCNLHGFTSRWHPIFFMFSAIYQHDINKEWEGINFCVHQTRNCFRFNKQHMIRNSTMARMNMVVPWPATQISGEENLWHEEIRAADHNPTERLVCAADVFATGKERGPHLWTGPQAKGCIVVEKERNLLQE